MFLGMCSHDLVLASVVKEGPLLLMTPDIGQMKLTTFCEPLNAWLGEGGHCIPHRTSRGCNQEQVKATESVGDKVSLYDKRMRYPIIPIRKQDLLV